MELFENKLTKGRNNLPINEIVNAHQCTKNRQSSTWPFWAERYTGGELEIHVHLWFNRSAQHSMHLNDYCAIFKSAHGQGEATLSNCMSKTSNVDVTSGDAGVRHVNLPMFGMVRDFVKKPKRVQIRRPVRSVVRLQALEECLSFDGEVCDFGQPTSSGWLATPVNLEINLPVNENGELGPVHAPTVLHTGNRDEMVESGAEIIDTISDDSPPLIWGWLDDPYTNDHFIHIGLEVEDGVVRVGVKELINLPLQGIKVFGRPLQLEDDRYRRSSLNFWHELNYNHEQREIGDSENTKGARDTRAHKGRMREELRQGGKAGEEITDSPPEKGLNPKIRQSIATLDSVTGSSFIVEIA